MMEFTKDKNIMLENNQALDTILLNHIDQLLNNNFLINTNNLDNAAFYLKTINQSHFAKFTILLIVIKLVLSPFTFYYIFSLNDDTLNIIKSLLDNLIMSIILASLVNVFFTRLKKLKIN